MKWKQEHDFTADVDTFIQIGDIEENSRVASLQIITDSDFNGTNSRAGFRQSNDPDLDVSLWHDLPEGDISMPNGEGSTLLSTVCFTAKYLGVFFDVGNADAGIAQLKNNYKAST